MSKITVPQIGDFVAGQKLTEHGRNTLSAIVERINLLEGDGSDTITESIEEIKASIKEIESQLDKNLPVVEMFPAGDLKLLEPGFSYYEITAVFKIPMGNNLSTYGMIPVPSTKQTFRTTSNEPTKEKIVTITDFYRSEDFESGFLVRTFSSHNVEPTQTPVHLHWIVRKYKSEF